MNEISIDEVITFQNPELKPLEDVKLIIKNNGITKTVPALDKYWVEKKYFLKYESLILFDEEGRNIIGAKERWLEIVSYIIDDLDWLLRLPFYKFWSNIVYNSRIIDSITIFLQEAPSFFTLESFINDYDLKDHLDRLRYYILLVLIRIITNKESTSEYISESEHARLIFKKNIITVPILMDICQQYGRNNRAIIDKIVNYAFALEPLYVEDLNEAVQFIIKALKDIQRRFEDCPIDQEGKAVLLSERGGANDKITLHSLEDLILYLLDIVSTTNIFINIYTKSVNNFRIADFLRKLVSVYANTIPEMYKKLGDLAFKDEIIAKYMELKHRLDVARIEILNIYRKLIYEDVKNVVETNLNVIINSETEQIIQDFLNNLEYMLSEKEFVIDYHKIYPVTADIQKLLDLNKNIDTVKCEYILNYIFTYVDEPSSTTASTSLKNVYKTHVESNGIKKDKTSEQVNRNEVAGSSKGNTKSKSDIVSLISEIKDILCNLGEGFLELCLKYYNYDKEAVINAVLEDSLPIELKSLDHNLPFIPPDPEEASAAIDNALGIQRLNIYDNDEFDVMTKDTIDSSKIHRGKRKDKYKNFNELLNDKSYIAQTKDIYNKYTIVTNEYDDEYDDTYDDQDIGSSAQDDIEVDARPFTIPRILRQQDNNDFEDIEEDTDFNHVSEIQVNRDNFVQDPALLREKAEERRLSKQGGRMHRNVVGNSKGQGQTKEVTDSRNQKGKNKASRANHNRRTGSQWKRSHGMVPS